MPQREVAQRVRSTTTTHTDRQRRTRRKANLNYSSQTEGIVLLIYMENLFSSRIISIIKIFLHA